MTVQANTTKAIQDQLVLGKTRMRDAAGFRGTVVYVGPVVTSSSSSTIYAGVVWDDHTRGKHNGTVVSKCTGESVQYFKAPHATAGSFVKLTKLQLGVQMNMELLEQKYVDLESNECVAPNNLLPHTAQTATGRNDKAIELLGEFQVRTRQQLKDVRMVSLRMAGIASIQTEPGHFSSLRHLKEIDLAGNLLSDWKDVWNVLDQFPCLKKLSVASNTLSDVSETTSKIFALEHLNVNQVAVRSIETIIRVGTLFPGLKELILAGNRVPDGILALGDGSAESKLATRLADALPNLIYLDCSNCSGLLSSTALVRCWSKLPNLQSLSLDDNPEITRFQSFDDDESVFFPKLQHLQLAGTGISEWNELESLHRLPHLTSLRLRNVPLLSSLSAAASRNQVISRLVGIDTLNSSSITESERREAARCSIRNAEHPEVEYWREKYPEMAKRSSPTRDASVPGSMNELVVISVTIVSMASSSCTQEPLQRRLPAELKVSKIKALCARQFGLDIDLQVLFFRESKDALPQAMDDDDCSLTYYGVPDGAEILMNEIDMKAKKRDEEFAERELEHRIERQEQQLQDFQERRELANSIQ